MIVTILCSSKVSILKRWHSLLLDENKKIYVTKTKNELFDYFNANKSSVILIIENELNDENNEEFLMLIRRTYPQVKVFLMSYEPNIKEASELINYGIKGYGNIYMQKKYLQEAINSIWNGFFWFDPKFLNSFDSNSEKITNLNTIGKITKLQSLAIARTNDEENIISLDDNIYEDELIITPYENSYITLELLNKENIEIQANSKILLDKTVFSQEDISTKCIFNNDKYNEILSKLGTNDLISGRYLNAHNQVEFIEEKSKNDKSNKGIEASYSGNFEEYDIYPSKNLAGFIVIKDKITNRDGSDLISQNISKLIFKDITKTYDELAKNIYLYEN